MLIYFNRHAKKLVFCFKYKTYRLVNAVVVKDRDDSSSTLIVYNQLEASE